jgi:hypothetical protein
MGEPETLVRKRTQFACRVWLEGPNIVRMSLQNPLTGTIAYLQSATPLLDFARELGLSVETLPLPGAT